MELKTVFGIFQNSEHIRTDALCISDACWHTFGTSLDLKIVLNSVFPALMFIELYLGHWKNVTFRFTPSDRVRSRSNAYTRPLHGWRSVLGGDFLCGKIEFRVKILLKRTVRRTRRKK
jgi:hypothetical protein